MFVKIFTRSCFIFYLFNSCASSVPSRDIIKRFTFCYDEKNTGIDSLININGYYESLDIWWNTSGYGKTYHPRWDTIHNDIVFFRDGIINAGGFGNVYNKETVPEYFKRLLENAKIGKKDSIFGSYYVGRYIITHDTIKTQIFSPPTPNGGVMAFEIWYKAIDRNTIQEIAWKKLYYDKLNQKPSEMDLRILDEDKKKIIVFYPVEVLPNSYSWLKKRKWFWCDEEKYEAWKKRLKK